MINRLLTLKESFNERMSLQSSKDLFNDNAVIKIINALPGFVAVLNTDRQVMMCNKAILKYLGINDKKEILGLRHGEVLKCINSINTQGNCGCSSNCPNCGMYNAINESSAFQQEVTKHCHISSALNGKYEIFHLNVTATPFEFGNCNYTFLSIYNIERSNKREFLERVFFHDSINIAGGLKGICEILVSTTSQQQRNEYTNLINSMSKELLEIILSQRAMIFAENSELTLEKNFSSIMSLNVLKETISFVQFQPISKHKNIILETSASCTDILTNEILLKRILLNMLRNALEASNENSDIILNCKEDGGYIIFSVYNSAFIPYDIQSKIYQPVFSTKGEGRGLGTYSTKLLTEKYLNGTTYFTSSQKNGTTFFVRIPKC